MVLCGVFRCIDLWPIIEAAQDILLLLEDEPGNIKSFIIWIYTREDYCDRCLVALVVFSDMLCSSRFANDVTNVIFAFHAKLSGGYMTAKQKILSLHKIIQIKIRSLRST